MVRGEFLFFVQRFQLRRDETDRLWANRKVRGSRCAYLPADLLGCLIDLHPELSSLLFCEAERLPEIMDDFQSEEVPLLREDL